jgi:tetratricopeptide (TPR) repeat protein
MPYKPYWLQRLPEIVEQLRSLPVAVVDRPTFESIFRLRRRRAIELMHCFGSYRGRRGFVLDRGALLERLESLETVAQYRWEEQVRFERVIDQLNAMEGNTSRGSDGPQSIAKRVVLEFADESDLTTKLLALLRGVCDGHGNQAGMRNGRVHHKLQYGRFEQAIQAFRKQSFHEAAALFAQACPGPDARIRTSAETYLRICRRRTEGCLDPSSFDDHYTYGVALLNDRRFPEARKQLESALQMNPCADYVYYTLAACLALSGDTTGLYYNLRRAIELQPRNRIAARFDPDFHDVLNDPFIRELLNSSSNDSAA